MNPLPVGPGCPQCGIPMGLVAIIDEIEQHFVCDLCNVARIGYNTRTRPHAWNLHPAPFGLFDPGNWSRT